MLDFHTHNLNANKDSIINISITDADRIKNGYKYSIGIHPWDSESVSAEELHKLSEIATNDNVILIGEAGLDKLKGANQLEQEELFRNQIKLSEDLSKPLLIHCVKAYQELIAIKKELKPKQPWIIHGYRGNEIGRAAGRERG